jgi:hypothetical protein
MPVGVISLCLLCSGCLIVAAAARASSEWASLSGVRFLPLVPIALIATGHFLNFIASLPFPTAAHCLTPAYTAPHFIAGLSRASCWTGCRGKPSLAS